MTDYQKIRTQLSEEKKKGSFIFLPSPIMDQSNSYYQPIIEIIRLREDEIYKATGKYRMHFNGLLRLALAAAVEWSAVDTCRTDAMNDRLYCSFRAVGGVRKADGKIYFHKAEKDLDLEIIEMELIDQYSASWEKVKGCSGNEAWKKHGHTTKTSFVDAMVRRDLIQKRKNKLMFVESGAKARVIRFLLGLQSQYSDKRQVLDVNFVMVHFALDPNHPDVKKALMGSLSASQHMIYGGVKDTGQIAHMEQEAEEVIDIPSGEPEADQDQEPEPEKNKFKPAQKNSDGNLVDFQNTPVDEQAKTLKQMCDDCGQSYENYNTEVKGGIKKAGQEWRDEFFTFLKGEKENQ